MEKNNIERQVEETLKSFDNIRRAQAGPFLYEKVMERLKHPQKIKPLSPAFALRFGLVCAIILVLNVSTYSHLSKTEKTYKKMALEEFTLGYFTNDTFSY